MLILITNTNYVNYAIQKKASNDSKQIQDSLSELQQWLQRSQC